MTQITKQKSLTLSTDPKIHRVDYCCFGHG